MALDIKRLKLLDRIKQSFRSSILLQIYLHLALQYFRRFMNNPSELFQNKRVGGVGHGI